MSALDTERIYVERCGCRTDRETGLRTHVCQDHTPGSGLLEALLEVERFAASIERRSYRCDPDSVAADLRSILAPILSKTVAHCCHISRTNDRLLIGVACPKCGYTPPAGDRQ